MDRPKKTSQDDNSPTRSKSTGYARYTGVAIKMIAIILAGTLSGRKLDETLENSIPVFTLILTLASVGLAMYVIIRDLGKK